MRAAADELRKRGIQVGDAVSESLKSMEESELMRAVCLFASNISFLSDKSFIHITQISRASSAVSSTIATTTEPLRKTEAYKALAETVLDALDDGGSARHAGFEEKEARRKRRQLRLEKAGKKSGIAARERVGADQK